MTPPLSLALLLCLASACAGRRSEPQTPERAQRIEQLPQVVDVPFVQCPATLADKARGVVVLAVQVLETGRVGDVRIVEDIGHGCGALAARALRSATFRPAVDADGRPFAAEIRYEYEFALDD